MACSFKIISSACLWTSSWKPLSYYSVCSTGTIARLGKDLSSVFQHLGLTGLFLTWYTCGSISVWRAFVISPGLLTNLYSEITASRKNMLNSFYPKEKKKSPEDKQDDEECIWLTKTKSHTAQVNILHSGHAPPKAPLCFAEYARPCLPDWGFPTAQYL